MDFDKVIDERRSIRDFSNKTVKWSDILEAIDSARKAPCAGNNFNLKFIIIKRSEAKDKIAELSEQSWIMDAPYLIVVCSNETNLEGIYYERGKIYSRQQAGAAIENLLLKLTDLKLSSCWIGAYQDGIIKQILKIPPNINIEAIIAVGYAKQKIKPPRKISLENIINWECWGISKKPKK